MSENLYNTPGQARAFYKFFFLYFKEAITIKKLSSIYCFTNKINKKQYIGSTIVSPNVRYNQHIYNATHKNAHQYNYPLYQAIRKYGIENFNFEILLQKECEEQEIRQIEKEYILKLKTLSPNGYNQTENTEHPINDLKSYQKISLIKREKSKRVAQIDENKNIIKIYRSIVDCAEEIHENERKIGSCCRGERKSTGGKFFAWIDENNQLIFPEYQRDLYKGLSGTTQIQSSSRKVAKIDLNTSQILDIYNTIALASRENNCDSSGISKVCNGKRKSCGGFKWKYIN